uniref:CUB domain-containing protein n=1 Tax=Strongyloides papillosus TaxID=174720 RepID=A0A0N5C9A1_STREA
MDLCYMKTCEHTLKMAIIQCCQKIFYTPKHLSFCVDGFTSQFCEKIAPPLRSCGQSDIVVLKKLQKLEVKGSKRCIYHIRTVIGKKIMLKFEYISVTSGSKVCKFSNCSEVKLLPDKTLTGELFCGKNPRTIFLSKDYHVILYYNLLFFSGGFKLFFRVM